jgi:hypothetical protein
MRPGLVPGLIFFANREYTGEVGHKEGGKMAKKKHQGHYCWRCQSYRANEKFSGKGHAKHICKDCSKEMKQIARERRKAKASRQEVVASHSDANNGIQETRLSSQETS